MPRSSLLSVSTRVVELADLCSSHWAMEGRQIPRRAHVECNEPLITGKAWFWNAGENEIAACFRLRRACGQTDSSAAMHLLSWPILPVQRTSSQMLGSRLSTQAQARLPSVHISAGPERRSVYDPRWRNVRGWVGSSDDSERFFSADEPLPGRSIYRCNE